MAISNKVKTLTILTIIVIVGVFYLLTVREGHVWGGDFSLYIHHAKNIVEGIDYKDTGYIYNPFYSGLGPKTYPPIFPFLLSPIYKWFGLDLTLMKIEIIIIFIIFLLVLFFTFRNELPFQYLVAMIAIVGFSPFFWSLKDWVQSDIPFLLFAYLALLCIHQAYQTAKSHRPGLLSAALVGLSIYLAYGTRSVGVVLVACLLIYDIIKFKKPTQLAIIATLLFVCLVALQTIFLHSDRSYLDQLAQVTPRVVVHNLFLYPQSLGILWNNGYSETFGNVLSIIILILAITGYMIRVKRRITIFEIFTVLYFITVIFWPRKYRIRFIMPVIPLYIFYALVSVKETKRKQIERSVFAILIIAIFASYAAKYTKINYGPIYGVDKKESIELFDYIKRSTKKEAIFVFERPRVLSLYTGRSASAYYANLPGDVQDTWDYFCKVNATYVILRNENQGCLPSFIKKYKYNFQEVYSNADFKVCKIIFGRWQ